MLEICIQTSYDQNVQLILKSYLPVVLGTTLIRYLITEMLEICIQISYDQNVQLILKSYLPVVLIRYLSLY